MSIALYPDLIRDSRWYETFAPTGVLTGARVDRSYYADGATGSSDQIQGLLKAAVQAVVPVGSSHPQRPEAKAREYRVEPWQSTGGAQVIVSYVYDGFTGVENQYVIESTGSLRQVPTDSEFDESGNLIPIEVDYYRDWSDIHATRPPDSPVYTASVLDMPVLRPTGGIRLTKTITSTKAATIETIKKNYLGYTNSTIFRANDANTMLCSQIQTVAQPFQGQYLAVVQWDYLPESWDGWGRFRNDQFGTPANIWRDWNATYDLFMNSNGFKRCRTYLRADMNALFSTVTG